VTEVQPAEPASGDVGLDDPRTAGERQHRRNLVNLFLDAGLIVAFLADQAVGFTGLPVHEWLGIVLGVALVVHVLLHADWIARTTRRLLTVPRRRQLLALVDATLFAAMVLAVVSGIEISRHALPGIGHRDRFWRWLHTESARATVLLVAVHVALGWDWLVKVVTVARRRSA
jgi:hypothetical protein